MNTLRKRHEEVNYYDLLWSNYYNNELENKNKMSEQIRGTIQAIGKPRQNTFKPNAAPYQSFKLNDVWYSNGTKVPPPEGTLVEFTGEQNDKGYWNVSKAGIKVVTEGAVSSNVGSSATAAAARTTVSRDDYWQRKDDRDIAWEKRNREVIQPTIELQAARNAAIEFVKLLLIPIPGEDKDGNAKTALPALKLGAQNKREQILFEAVQKYTDEFVKLNQSISENKNKNEQSKSPVDPTPAQANREERSTDTDDSAWNV